MQCVCEKQQKQKKLLSHYEAKVLSTNSSKEKQDLQFPISKLKTSLYLSFLWIKKYLHTIGELCKVSTRLLGTTHLLKLNGICELAQNPNVNLLHDVSTVTDFCYVDACASITQQGSTEWKSNRKLSVVTASTIYTALGFRGLAEAKLHFREFVLGQDDREYDEFTYRRIQHGSENEVNIISNENILYSIVITVGCNYAIQYHRLLDITHTT